MRFFNRFAQRQNQYGLTLVEASIVLGIFGLIIGGIFAAWSTVATQQRVRKAADMVTVIVEQVRSTYATRTALDSTSGATFTGALINSELIPNSWVSSGNIFNPWGGNILVTPETIGTTSAMNVSISQINKPDCLKLANNILGAARTQGLIQVDGTTVTNASNYSTISGTCTSTTLSLHFALKTTN